MKKASIWSSVVFLLAVLLAACTGTQPQTSAQPAVTEVVTEAAPVNTPAAAANAQSEGCLGTAEGAIVDLNCREVTIAVENAYLPFNYITVATNEPGGWDYDAWTEICTRLHCKPVFVETAWEGMIQGAANNQYDVAADGITITDERAKIVDFSTGYLKIQQRLLVRKGETRFDSLDKFVADSTLVLGTQANTTNYETAKAVLPETRLKAFEQMPFAIQAMLSSDVDAVIIDEVVGMGYLGENADQMQFVGSSISSDALGFAFPKGSQLIEPVNKALAAMQADGSLQKINIKFFGPDFKVSQEDIK